jgi:raffinose/stachyose/melibiose transport system permease protein
MLDCCKKNKWFYFGLTIPSMLLYVLALAGPLLLGTLPASFYNWNLIKGNKDFVGLGNYTKLLGDETFIHSVVFTLILAVISILMSNCLSISNSLIIVLTSFIFICTFYFFY